MNDKVVARGGVSRRTVIRSAVTGAVLVGTGALGACAAGGGGGNTGNQPNTTGGAPKTAENPFGVEKGKALEVVIFDGGHGKDYGAAHVEMYNAKWGPGAKMSSTVKVASTLQPRFVGGNPPDVIDNSGADQMPTAPLVAQNQLTVMAALLDAPTIDDPSKKIRDILLPGAIEQGSVDGKVVMLPYAFSMFGLWYSKPLFEKNGWTAPKTMDEFMALCEKIKSGGKMAPFIHTGVHTQYMTNVITGQAIKVAGLELVNKIDNLEPDSWANDAMLSVAKKWEEVTKAGYIYPAAIGQDHTTSQTEWLNGKAAMIPCGSWLQNEMKGKVPEGFDMVAVPFPSMSAADKLPYEAVVGGAGEQFIVPTKAANVAGGLEYIRIMLSKAGTAKFAELTGSLCAVKEASAGANPSLALKSVQDAMAKAGENIFSLNFMSWYAPLKTAGRDAARNLLSGKMTAEQYVATMQKAVDDVKNDAKIKKYQRS